MSPVWDHWPVEVEVFVPRPWVLLRNSQPPVRWNKHALQVALDDRAVGNAFLRDCEQAALHVTHSIAADMNHKALEAHWMKLQLALHDVAKLHFAMRPHQKSVKLLPTTFDLLDRRRHAQHDWLVHMDTWYNMSLTRPLLWFFVAFRLFVNFSRLQRPAKQAVKNDEKSWFSFLETRLQNATDHHDFREAWSVCRLLAGQGPSKVCDKTVPAARAICRRQWLEHFASVWGAWLHDSAVVEPQCWGGLPLTPALVGDGRVALLKAAKAQARYLATPQGALPAELWQLVMQKRCVGPRSFNLVPDLCMKAFEQFPLRGYNPQCWCDGEGCPLPKPGGASGPDGQRIINLLDPGGKMFYKDLLEFVPDVPAPYQYGYAPRRSRREAILQVEAWLDRLRANNSALPQPCLTSLKPLIPWPCKALKKKLLIPTCLTLFVHYSLICIAVFVLA